MVQSDEQKKMHALKRATKRIVKLFGMSLGLDVMSDGFELRKPFLDRKFDWALGSSINTGGKGGLPSTHKETLEAIFHDIAAELKHDGTNAYAREASNQAFFDHAWGGGETFRKTQQYFLRSEYDQSEEPKADYIYNKDDDTKLNDLDLFFYKTPQQALEDILFLKESIAEFEHRVEAYGKSLRHHLKEIAEVKNAVSGLLRSNQGLPFENSITSKGVSQPNYWRQIMESGNQEDEILARVRGHLEERGLDSPIILDHVYASTHGGLDEKGFERKGMNRYFDRLEKNTSANAETCESIKKYCADTRAHIDRIIQQECRKKGIEQ